jgi:hypothetical protein
MVIVNVVVVVTDSCPLAAACHYTKPHPALHRSSELPESILVDEDTTKSMGASAAGILLSPEEKIAQDRQQAAATQNDTKVIDSCTAPRTLGERIFYTKYPLKHSSNM